MNRNKIVRIPDTDDYCNKLPTDIAFSSQQQKIAFVIHISHAYIPKYTPTI